MQIAEILSQRKFEIIKQEKVNDCYEIATLFAIELNKTAGVTYITKLGKKGVSASYTPTRVLKDMKKIKISQDVHKMNGLLSECLKSEIGFRRYYLWKVK
jgi:hypothetical protein